MKTRDRARPHTARRRAAAHRTSGTACPPSGAPHARGRRTAAAAARQAPSDRAPANRPRQPRRAPSAQRPPLPLRDRVQCERLAARQLRSRQQVLPAPEPCLLDARQPLVDPFVERAGKGRVGDHDVDPFETRDAREQVPINGMQAVPIACAVTNGDDRRDATDAPPGWRAAARVSHARRRRPTPRSAARIRGTWQRKIASA